MQNFYLMPIPSLRRKLHTIQIGVVIDPGIGVPVSSIDFEGNIVIRQKYVNTSRILARFRISNKVLWLKHDAKGLEFSADSKFYFANAWHFMRSQVLGSSLAKFGPCFIRMPIAICHADSNRVLGACHQNSSTFRSKIGWNPFNAFSQTTLAAFCATCQRAIDRCIEAALE